MRFDQVLLTGSETITLFDLRNPRSTSYVTRTIDGLGPTEVNVTLAQTSQGSGIYIGRREQLRDITINGYLNPDYLIGESPEQLREAVYLMRPVKEDLSLDFRLMLNGVEIARTPVYVKRVEVAPFSKDTTFQIILASTSGYFHSNLPSVIVDPTFDQLHPTLINEGSATTGFKLSVEFTGVVDAFGFTVSAPSSKMVLQKLPNDGALFLGGDILDIDTTIGSRSIKFTRGGITKSALAALTEDSTWLALYPGENFLTTIQNPGSTPRFVWKRFEHVPKYLGV